MLAVLPKKFQDLLKVISINTKYSRASFKSKELQHVLILGDAPVPDVELFLKEFYHSDHGQNHIICVILRPYAPCKEMQRVLKDFAQKGSLKPVYLEGNPL